MHGNIFKVNSLELQIRLQHMRCSLRFSYTIHKNRFESWNAAGLQKLHIYLMYNKVYVEKRKRRDKSDYVQQSEADQT